MTSYSLHKIAPQDEVRYWLDKYIYLPIRKWLYRHAYKLASYLVDRFSKTLIRRQTKTHQRLTKIFATVKLETPEQARIHMPFVNKFIEKHMDIMADLEDVSFFGNAELEKVFNSNYRLLNKIETTLRKKAFSDVDHSQRVSYEFIEELTNHSINSLHNSK